ncbi:MAG TPA: hypothetical protein VNJ08_08160 [Bacteriovoracaceae bacterium]|nr:hypothetical protein [Bacteriovoracaceae bacterium]
MDKSFNDQELSDIMKEIEALEDNFQTEEETHSSPIMEELAELDESEAVPFASPRHAAHVLPMAPQAKSKPQGTTPTNMSFKVSGDINLELQFDIGGKIVCLEVNENGLNIQMEGGMTFSVPLKKTA